MRRRWPRRCCWNGSRPCGAAAPVHAWAERLGHVFGVVDPGAATHYDPTSHPARWICFGDVGASALLYPTGRVCVHITPPPIGSAGAFAAATSGSGRHSPEKLVELTLSKVARLCVWVAGGAAFSIGPVTVDTMLLGVEGCVPLADALAQDLLCFDRIAEGAAARKPYVATGMKAPPPARPSPPALTPVVTWAPEVLPALVVRFGSGAAPPPPVGTSDARTPTLFAFESGKLVLSGVRNRRAAEAAYATFVHLILHGAKSVPPGVLPEGFTPAGLLSGGLGEGAPALEQEEQEEEEEEEEEGVESRKRRLKRRKVLSHKRRVRRKVFESEEKGKQEAETAELRREVRGEESRLETSLQDTVSADLVEERVLQRVILARGVA